MSIVAWSARGLDNPNTTRSLKDTLTKFNLNIVFIMLISKEWSVKYPKAIEMIEAVVASNHNPIIIFLEGLKKRRKKDFKFESRWLLEEDCQEDVKEAWSENYIDNGYSI
ncbi:hypothetical protein GQ457_17G010350 [Hibiscus cannabinus]